MNIYLAILLMAVTTYLIRALPFVLFRREIKNCRVRSFLAYVPYACLTAMTVPSILYATQSMISAVAGFAVAIFLGYKRHSLPDVAIAACLTVYVVDRVLGLL